MSKWIAEFELEDGDTMPEHMDLNYMGARIDFHCRPLEQESKTGHWNSWFTEIKGNNTFNCMECGSTFIVEQGAHNMNYCPNCGAKMEG